MSQSNPPNGPESGDAGNPYYQQAGSPDLDASTPVLKDEETQRLNRKALFFLGGTLLLVLLMAVLVLSSGDDGPDNRAPEPDQSVSVPQLPRAVTQRPEAEPPPIPVVEDALVAEPPPPLPPLPLLPIVPRPWLLRTPRGWAVMLSGAELLLLSMVARVASRAESSRRITTV